MTNIISQGKIKKVSETILSVDSGLEHELVCVVTVAFDNLERRDYLRLARASLAKEPVRVTFTLAQTELPLDGVDSLDAGRSPAPARHPDGQTVTPDKLTPILTSAYQLHSGIDSVRPFPGVA